MAAFIDFDGLKVYDEEIKKYLDKKIKSITDDFSLVIYKDSILSFPVVGDVQNIYVDTTQNKIYRWSATDTKYYCIGSDWEDIQIISGQF